MTEETNPVEVTPTPAEAKIMFLDTPGLDSVVTTEGRLYRNGTLEPLA